ncbi:hypothetical protein KW458_06425 [Vibrio fluvialis]|uniref:hypothetical protein n=1 Tax=Vibrio furnissii TaxID=29494 RepID=UPI0012AD62B3|nr:hypothetical protein [Vibrio furnissii]MBY7905122.1 hypothetical protein [Vibrio fluvialis]
MISYLVSNFGKDELSNLVKECFGTDFPDIFNKKQIDYLFRYLKDLKANSVLLEPKYIDKDYLEDFNNYYVKCFGNNGFMSARLHFFSKKIDHKYMTDILTTGDQRNIEDLQHAYLGFIVIKPLAKTFIGKTCLKTYASVNQEDGNKVCLHREYNVDLFGIPLSVSSVAFQEQDKVVSACATTAIWSSLHAMRWKNVRDIRSCSEITTNAVNHIPGSNNSFPNLELSNKQILRALDFEKLKHHTIDVRGYESSNFLSLVKTHIDSNIPLILGVDVYEKNDNDARKLDGHAITVLGYKNKSIGDNAIYVHDDRLGPYARAEVIDTSCMNFLEETKWGLALQEKSDDGKWKSPHEILVVNSLIIPAPHKVRLPSSFASKTCEFIMLDYENLMTELERKGEDVTENRDSLTFDVVLSEISKIRQDIISEDFAGNSEDDLAILQREKVKFLTGSYARFQWVSSFHYNGTPIFKILLDATDIPQGNAVSAIFIQNKKFADMILERHVQILNIDNDIQGDTTTHFYGSILKYLKPEEESFNSYLDKRYGELRAPKYIKSEETNNGNIAENKNVRKFYHSTEDTLEQMFPDLEVDNKCSFMLWTIAHDGALLIGEEVDGKGHPTLTGFKPSRIAGELLLTSEGWRINSKSGRYSTDYDNKDVLLANAAERFKDIFRNSRKNITFVNFE